MNWDFKYAIALTIELSMDAIIVQYGFHDIRTSDAAAYRIGDCI